MSTSRKLYITIAVSFLITLSAWPLENDKTKPRSNEVVLVFRITTTPQIDDNFFSNYIEINTPHIKTVFSGKKKSEKPKHSLYIEINKTGDIFAQNNFTYAGSLGEFCFLKIQIPKNRQVRIDLIQIKIFNNPLLFIKLPVFVKTIVPENTNYLYIGSLNYRFADEFFTISSASKIDEYDAAAVQLAKLYGPDAKLYRANLTEIEKEDK